MASSYIPAVLSTERYWSEGEEEKPKKKKQKKNKYKNENQNNRMRSSTKEPSGDLASPTRNYTFLDVMAK